MAMTDDQAGKVRRRRKIPLRDDFGLRDATMVVTGFIVRWAGLCNKILQGSDQSVQ